ncbi:hypothetical protein I79_002303 [Cricetulus griseus]|uniref:Uncharacterized protein n=1 Tax=Cricetulus griseus TaxID=10029 RepID=G3GX16_CRIGR|nr:hypothetical protein I79_002303 [Cricetulus griseus]
MAHRRALPSPSLFRAGLSGTLVARQSDGTKVMRAQGGGVQVCGWEAPPAHLLRHSPVASHLRFSL